MDPAQFPVDMMSTACFLLLMMLKTNRILVDFSKGFVEEEAAQDRLLPSSFDDNKAWNMEIHTQAALHDFRLWSSHLLLDEDLGYWVKPRSTTWFSQFLLHEYDDRRWIEMFRFSKSGVFRLAALLAPAIRKKDTKYCLAVPVAVRLACTLFKLSHGSSFLIVSELFAVGRSTVSIILRQVI